MAGVPSPKCEICQDTGKINWKCFECDTFLCEACLKVHSISKKLKEHKIVILNYVGIAGVELKTIKSYKTDLLGISSIIPIDDKSIWITGSTEDNRLQRIQLDDDVKVLQDIQGYSSVGGSKLTGELVLLHVKSSGTIKSLSTTGVKANFCNISPQQVLCSHATNKEVLIGSCEVLKQSDERYRPTENSRRQVHIFTLDGQETKVLEKDDVGTRLLTYPLIIASNSRSDIIVCDEMEHTKSRIICFNQNGQIKWNYIGNSEIGENLYVTGMAVTPKENVVFVDIKAQSLNILNIDGRLIYCKHTTEINITSPTDVAVLSADKLLISNVLLGQIRKDKLYVVNYSGF